MHRSPTSASCSCGRPTGSPEAGLGIFPGLVDPQRAVRSLRRAGGTGRVALLGEMLTAEEALAAGFVDRVVPKCDGAAAAARLTDGLLARPPRATELVKLLLNAAEGAEAESVLEVLAGAVAGPPPTLPRVSRLPEEAAAAVPGALRGDVGMNESDRDFLVDLFHAAVRAADPETALRQHLPLRPAGRTVVVGAGKGVAQLAASLERLWDGPLEGVVVTRYGYGCPTERVRVLEAAHPVPDAAGLVASKALFAAVRGLEPEDLVVALVCGGGSSLLPCPPGPLGLEDEAALNRALLASGAPISVMNAIRKHVSGIKGGRLAAAAWPARVVTLIVSDVPGDDPAQVASGPTVPDAVDRAAARALAGSWRIALPPAVAAWLERPEAAAPDAADPRFARNEVRVIASARLSLEAAAANAAAAGVPAAILSDAIEGEARDVGRVHAAIAREVALRGRPFARPVVILSGGETTVTLRDEGGRGGRNSEFLLALAIAAEGLPVAALAADTDGIDGSETNAGAFADGAAASRLRAAGLDPLACLGRNDAWTAFDRLGALFVTGPTGTNVNDFRAILVR